MEKKLRIHDVSERLGIHPNTIRHLEQRGLITAARSLTGHRLFTEGDIQKIREIYKRQDEGTKNSSS